MNKSTVHGILRNLTYTDKFVWDGKEYAGKHEPIVSSALWDRVQAILDHRYSHRYRVVKHDLPFSGLIRCGHCGCSVVGEIKKEKYIYYRCTHQGGKCPDRHVRQEVIESQFCDVIGRIVLPAPFVQWAGDVLHASCADDVRLREESVNRLSAELSRIQQKLEAMYMDKLDGRIMTEMYDRYSTEWKREQERLEICIEEHRSGVNKGYIFEGVQLLKLLKNMKNLFEQQPPREKRKLLKFVVSNSTWKEGKLAVIYRQPFDYLPLGGKQ